MGNSCGSNGFYICNGNCHYKGVKISNPPRFNPNHSINLTTTDYKIYLNGYEYLPKQMKWKRTFRAIWHLIF